MKFSKYNNPNRRKTRKRSPYSSAYISERKDELVNLLAKTDDPKEQEALIKAFQITVRP